MNIIEPNPFTVFAGSNGAGKSNIFEALAFLYYLEKTQVDIAISLFGNSEDLLTRDTFSNKISFKN